VLRLLIDVLKEHIQNKVVVKFYYNDKMNGKVIVETEELIKIVKDIYTKEERRIDC